MSVLLFHHGCTTGITQVNDTDLHDAFSRDYVGLECQSFLDRQMVCPGDIGRSNQDVIDDAVQTWRNLDHTEGVRGHKRTGLSLRLDGSEDFLIETSRREAGEFWKALLMRNRR